MDRQLHRAKQEIWQLLKGSLLINYHLRNKLRRLRCFQSLHGKTGRVTQPLWWHGRLREDKTLNWIKCKCNTTICTLIWVFTVRRKWNLFQKILRNCDSCIFSCRFSHWYARFQLALALAHRYSLPKRWLWLLSIYFWPNISGELTRSSENCQLISYTYVQSLLMKIKANIIQTLRTVGRRASALPFQHTEINHTNWKDCYLSGPEAAEEEEENGGQRSFFCLLSKVRNWPWKVHTVAFSFQLWICEIFFFFSLL